LSSTTLAVDINSDMGERAESLWDSSEEQLMRFVTSANIACGGHAGDPTSMQATVWLAKKYGVCVGAHPSFPDQKNFGRIQMQLSRDEIRKTVHNQIEALGEVCSQLRCQLTHVKPHGALYNVAVKNLEIAAAIAEGTKLWSSEVILVGLAGSEMIEVWKDAGFRVAEEAFVDRAYEADGTLRSRDHDDALLTDAEKATQRTIELIKTGTVAAIDGTILRLHPTTLCIHSDTPGSYLLARTLREGLRKAGVDVKPLITLT